MTEILQDTFSEWGIPKEEGNLMNKANTKHLLFNWLENTATAWDVISKLK